MKCRRAESETEEEKTKKSKFTIMINVHVQLHFSFRKNNINRYFCFLTNSKILIRLHAYSLSLPTVFFCSDDDMFSDLFSSFLIAILHT